MNKLKVLEEIRILQEFLTGDGSASNDPIWIIAVAQIRLSIISSMVQSLEKGEVIS